MRPAPQPAPPRELVQPQGHPQLAQEALCLLERRRGRQLPRRREAAPRPRQDVPAHSGRTDAEEDQAAQLRCLRLVRGTDLARRRGTAPRLGAATPATRRRPSALAQRSGGGNSGEGQGDTGGQRHQQHPQPRHARQGHWHGGTVAPPRGGGVPVAWRSGCTPARRPRRNRRRRALLPGAGSASLRPWPSGAARRGAPPGRERGLPEPARRATTLPKLRLLACSTARPLHPRFTSETHALRGGRREGQRAARQGAGGHRGRGRLAPPPRPRSA